jgi:methylenetetrahydrofolate--tRNA-(uracil-5-)-methyltransferase
LENKTVTVIGAGLAGSEAAYQLAMAGFQVNLYEMRPLIQTGAHTTDYFAELICSNSLGSNLPDRAAGVLKNELRRMGSLLMKIADEFELPAGGALAVDRDLFS